jgi:hypothetical protein
LKQLIYFEYFKMKNYQPFSLVIISQMYETKLIVLAINKTIYKNFIKAKAAVSWTGGISLLNSSQYCIQENLTKFFWIGRP